MTLTKVDSIVFNLLLRQAKENIYTMHTFGYNAQYYVTFTCNKRQHPA